MGRYLICGGAGFLGSHLCDTLIARGDFVTCLDSLITGSTKNIDHLLLSYKFTFAQADVCNLIDRFGQYDGIFHLASCAAPADINRNKESTLAANSDGTKTLSEYAKKIGAKLLFVSTMKVYGDCARVDSYIKGKRAGEKVCLKNNDKVARLASVYGPRMLPDDSRVIPVFINKCLKNEPISLWNGGSQVDSFCYVSDIVRGLIAFMDSDHTGVIELGSENGIAIKELADMILRMTGSMSEIITTEKVTVVDQCHNLPDLTNARNKLDWKPEISLHDGLLKTVQYFRGL